MDNLVKNIAVNFSVIGKNGKITGYLVKIISYNIFLVKKMNLVLV